MSSELCQNDSNPFVNLPVEVFLHICSFLETKILLHTLRLVCTRFNAILSDESLWRLRITKIVTDSSCPLINKFCDYFSWKELSYHIDTQRSLWQKNGANMRRIKWENFQISSVDCVKLIKGGNICISGSRDRSIAVWDVENEPNTPLIHCTDAHKGWVWNFASMSDSSFYSASWDQTVKQWHLTDTLEQSAVFECDSSALCVDCREDLLVAGLYSTPQVVFFDPRAGPKSINKYTAHKSAAIAVCLVDSYVVSSSSDKSVAVYDTRTNSILHSNIMGNKRVFGMSLAHRYGLLYVGDNSGNIHAFDTNLGKFTHIQTAPLQNMNSYAEIEAAPTKSFKNQVTSVWHGPGCVIVGSTSKYVRILTSTLPHMIIAHLPYDVEVTSVDYKNSILAVGTTDNTVEVWKPKNLE